jgi:hypothetical protein
LALEYDRLARERPFPSPFCFDSERSAIVLENHHSAPSTIASSFGVSLNLPLFPRSMAATILDHSHGQELKRKGETRWKPLAGKPLPINPSDRKFPKLFVILFS